MRNVGIPARPAYTLVEVMCVMAIIVIVAGIAVPVYRSMMADMSVTAAADAVRARMADTRSRAMEQCRPWRFGFLPNTGVFQLAPDDSSEWAATSQSATETSDLLRDELPKDIIFGLGQGDILGAHEGGATAGSKWETICVYMPDGSALDDSTTYFGKAGLMPMRIRLRGLTGAVAVETAIMVKENGQP